MDFIEEYLLRAFFLTLVLFMFTGGSAYAHSGGTNARGCHREHSTGDYHCHSPRAEGAYERQMDGLARRNANNSGNGLIWLILIVAVIWFLNYLFSQPGSPPPASHLPESAPPPTTKSPNAQAGQPTKPSRPQQSVPTPEKTQQLPVSLSQLKSALTKYRECNPKGKSLDPVFEMKDYKLKNPSAEDIKLTLNCELTDAAAIRMVVYAKTHFSYAELRELEKCLAHKPRRIVSS